MVGSRLLGAPDAAGRDPSVTPITVEGEAVESLSKSSTSRPDASG